MVRKSSRRGAARLCRDAICAVLLAGSNLSSAASTDSAPVYDPEYQQVILKHQAKKFSDQQLRDLWAKAGAEREALLKESQREHDEYWATRKKTLSLCKDVVFETKNPGTCKRATITPIGISLGPTAPPQQLLYERYVMGECGRVGIARAKELGCFPAGYEPRIVKP